MAWIARDGDFDNLYIFSFKPERNESCWSAIGHFNNKIKLPTDADKKLIGRHITWEDEPVEI